MSYLYNDLVGFKADAVDAFSRLKVANPFTLFDSQNRYQANDKWDTFGITGGTYSYSVVESAVNLIVGTTLGSKVTRETKRVFPYQPGKSLLILNTFAMNTPKAGLRQRIGYFGITGGATSGIPYNGVYLQQNGLTLTMNLVSASLNTTYSVTQSEWNGDPFDGTGPSGRVLDISKTNIFWSDIEWLGVGDLRTGFYVDGKPVIAHTFHNDNIHTTTYMTTACLPIRTELENLTGQTGSSQMKQICSSVISDGGYEGFSRQYNVSTDADTVNLATAKIYYPVMSIRLNSNRLDGIIVPSALNIVTTSNATIHYRIALNGTFTGTAPTWLTHYNGNVDYSLHNTALTGITGYNDILGGYINAGSVIDLTGLRTSFNFQLGRTQAGVSDILTIVAAGFSPNTNIAADFSWFEII